MLCAILICLFLSLVEALIISEFCFRTVNIMDNSKVQLLQKGHGTGTEPLSVTTS
jgi:hypothetical protein